MLLELNDLADGAGSADRSMVVGQGSVTARGVDSAILSGYVRVSDEVGGRRVWLTEGGRGAVQRLLQCRADLGARRQAVCDALLHFLHRCDLAGDDHVQDAAFLQSGWGSFYLDPFRYDELDAASRFLLGERLVAQPGSWGSLPVITPAGQRLVRGGRSVMDAAGPSAGSSFVTTVTNSTGVNVAQGSLGATQSVTLSAAEVAEVERLVAAVRALFHGSDQSAAEVSEVEDVVGELELAAHAPGPSRHRVGRLVSRLAGAVGNATAQAVASALVGPVVHLAEHLARALGS